MNCHQISTPNFRSEFPLTPSFHPGAGVPTGQATFEFVTKHRQNLAVKTLGTEELSRGEVTLTFKPNQVLKKPLTIVYSGDPDFLASMMIPPKLTKSEIASSRI